MLIAPLDALTKGTAVLSPFLSTHGFTLRGTEIRGGSGGNAAVALFSRNDRSITLHHRFGLGIVEYAVGASTVGHEAYLEFLGVESGSKYLWAALSNGITPYTGLLDDLTRFFDNFLDGDGHVLVNAAGFIASKNANAQKELMAECVGDNRMRQQARMLFREMQYARVVQLFESLRYPELLTESEHAMRRIAQGRQNST